MKTSTFMLDRTSSSWFYPKPTGDPGRDRNARTLQFACFLLAFAVGTVALLNAFQPEPRETELLVSAMAGLVAAASMNRCGRRAWGAPPPSLARLLPATL